MYLITGANGFVGLAVAKSIYSSGVRTLGSVRSLDKRVLKIKDTHFDIQWCEVGDVGPQTNWTPSLKNINVVVHCAARVHVFNKQSLNNLDYFRLVNVGGTLRLAQQAATAGVKRFVFLSSIGVNGNQTTLPFTEDSFACPHDFYARSKQEAEHALLDLASKTGMEVVIIRPPLIYGPGAPGNFGSLVRWVQRGVPLPLGAVHNQRSLVALDNLVSLVLLCADRDRSPQAANQVFVVADGEDVSTSTLLRKVARAAGRPSHLLPVPASWLRAGASLLGKRAVADRLLGNLQVDATKARTLLGWRPVVTMDEQLAKMFPQKD